MLYSCFINGLKKVFVEIDCKIFVDIVVYDKVVFSVLVEVVKGVLV